MFLERNPISENLLGNLDSGKYKIIMPKVLLHNLVRKKIFIIQVFANIMVDVTIFAFVNVRRRES
ncbi:hypothetical protein H8356DRAFT_1346515 [Neocallimastix lanati (nom. inval.)]|nr:hypothetical protein H8356DRAFT_1346515 [Neocallimastix sp. JGI-2020a]